MELTPEQLEQTLRLLEELLDKLWGKIPPDAQARLRDLYIALRQAIMQARQAGVAGAGPALITLIERLQAFLARLRGVWPNRFWETYIKDLVARLGQLLRLATGAAAGEAGGTVVIGGVTITGITAATVAALLFEVVIVVFGLILWWDYWAEVSERTDAPLGGKPCGDPMPVAQGLTEWDISWGTARSWRNLMAKVRKTAETYQCKGDCDTGECKGSAAITDFDQTRALFVTHSWCRFDVYCECL